MIFGIGLTIPMMSVTAFLLSDALDDGHLASWLFVQIPATIVLMTTLTLRLTFSNYFEPTGAMYPLLLAAPTSPGWWFGKLLLFRSKAVIAALAFFGVAALMSLQVDAARRVPMLTLIVAEVIITTLWLFALTAVCRPRFLALPALIAYLVLTYIVPLTLPANVGPLPWYALGTAIVATLVTLRWPHPAMIVLQAAAWSYARNLTFLIVPSSAAMSQRTVSANILFTIWDLLSGGRGGWWFGRPSAALSFAVPGVPAAEGARAVMIGDLVVLVVAILWLRHAFDAMVGRSSFQLVPRFLLRRRGDARAAVRRD
jgi:hypothetical protein